MTEYQFEILLRAETLISSKQDVPEWPGALFLRADKSDRRKLMGRFAHIVIDKVQIDPRDGVSIQVAQPVIGAAQMYTVPLDRMGTFELADKASNLPTAENAGLIAGIQDGLSWIGMTRSKWSEQPAQVCALEVLATVEGIPTSRQENSMNPGGFVGCAIRPGEKQYVNRDIIHFFMP